MTAPARKPLPAVIPFDGEDAWSVASHTRPGVRHKASRTPIGLWSCSCEYGAKAAERLNTKPCVHLRDVADYLAAEAERINREAVA